MERRGLPISVLPPDRYPLSAIRYPPPAIRQNRYRKAESGKRKADSGKRIAESGKRRAEGGKRKAEGGKMFDRMLSLVVALSLALLVWLYARSRDQEVLDNVPLPVQVAGAPGQADNYSLELTGPSHVMVSFSGPPVRIREAQGMLQRKELLAAVTLTVPDERLHE